MENWHLARNFRFAGVACGIRPDSDLSRLDLALIVSDAPAAAAGAFTQNRVVAAPVRVCRERLPATEVRGIVLCSGNANACTGDQGMSDARRMTQLTAETLGLRPEQFLVCSTGVIGRLLPMPKIEHGISHAARDLANGPESLTRAAQAILTTDTHIKVSTREFSLGGQSIRLTGLAKGAAMIGPNMATMLAVVLTDAAVSSGDLARLAPRVAQRSFNCISVEGHTSTNDSLIFLANGSGPKLSGTSLERFEQEAQAVCVDLARAIAGDAEGATHFVTIDVEGLRTEDEAHRIAKAVAESALVKTALFGADPNWGRIVSAAGYAGVPFEEAQLSLWLGEHLLYERGTPLPFDAAIVSNDIKAHRDLHIRLLFTLGQARCTFYTCDLTHDYVSLNADYTT